MPEAKFFCTHCQQVKDRKLIGMRHPSGSVCAKCLQKAKDKKLDAKGSVPWFDSRHGHRK